MGKVLPPLLIVSTGGQQQQLRALSPTHDPGQHTGPADCSRTSGQRMDETKVKGGPQPAPQTLSAPSTVKDKQPQGRAEDEGQREPKAGRLPSLPPPSDPCSKIWFRFAAAIYCLTLPKSTTFLLCYFISLWSSLLWPHVRLIFLFRGNWTKFPLVGSTSPVGPGCLEAYKASGSHHPFPSAGVRKHKHSGRPLIHTESYKGKSKALQGVRAFSKPSGQVR